jgi:hypothetical protein
MEMGYPNGTATLVCFADGTSSMYFSSGGGIIGGHSHEGVRRAAAVFLATVNQLLASMEPTRTFPLPAAGHVSFSAQTDAGLLRADAAEGELKKGHHPLSPLFIKGHDVITELRLITERMDSSSDQA